MAGAVNRRQGRARGQEPRELHAQLAVEALLSLLSSHGSRRRHRVWGWGGRAAAEVWGWGGRAAAEVGQPRR
jgi:hypothetical protein